MTETSPGPNITPTPTAAEAAAIAVALDALWPTAVVVADDEGAPATSRWRFSGRWWSRSTPGPRSRQTW